MGETASKGAWNNNDNRAPTPSLASNCSQGGSQVLPMSTMTTKGTGATWHRQQQQQPLSTCPQPCKQLLAGWIAGTTNVDKDGEGNASINDNPAPASNCSWVFLLHSFFVSFFVGSFFVLFILFFVSFILLLFHPFFFVLCVSFFVCFISRFIILISLCR